MCEIEKCPFWEKLKSYKNSNTDIVSISDRVFENKAYFNEAFRLEPDNHMLYEDNKAEFIITKALFLRGGQITTKIIKFLFEKGYKSVKSNVDYPLLIKIPINKIRNNVSPDAKKIFEKNLKTVFSFLNNSSIWIRIVDEDDYNKAIAEFNYFRKINLYDYDSAKENIDYNIRIQSQNCLESFDGGHGNYVTPVLYGDERKSLDILISNNQSLDNKPTDIGKGATSEQAQSVNPQVLFTEKEELKGMFKHMEKFHDIALRILLIDDKLGPEDNELGQTNKYKLLFKKKSEPSFDIDAVSIEMKRCKKEKCQTCKRLECKLRVLKQLMDDGEDVNTKNTIFDGIGKTKDYFYWKESDIETYYCPTIIEDFIDNDDNALDFSKYSDIKVYSDSEPKTSNKQNDEENKPKTLEVECHFEPKIEKNDLHVQIVGVRDVRTALLLLSKYKFDMVFSDYLLDKKTEKSEEREYANQLFKFLNRKQITNEQKKEYRELLKLKKEGNLPDDKKEPFKHLSKRNALETLRHDVLDNRGPLGQLWIMPITGFNQTFIQDIYRDGTNLIDYKWNISNGADPITTPWQFLYHLNMFIELQLRSSVYRTEQLLQFLKYTCDDLEEFNNAQEDKKKKLNFDDFKSFMGSEYATFTQLYGNKLPIKRDALTEGESDYNSDSKSVFATYVWKNFYADKDAYNVVELCRLMHRFYYLASYMYNDRVGTQRLNEALANLLFFVKTNCRVQGEIENNVDFNKVLPQKLELLREIISKYTNNQQDKRN